MIVSLQPWRRHWRLGKVAESGRIAFMGASWRRQLKRRSEEGMQGRAKTRNKDLEVGEFLLLLGN